MCYYTSLSCVIQTLKIPYSARTNGNYVKALTEYLEHDVSDSKLVNLCIIWHAYE